MNFIHASDYDFTITREHLLQLIEDDPSLIDRAERMSEERVRSHVRTNYDELKAFPHIFEYSALKAYAAGNYVRHTKAATLTEPEFTGIYRALGEDGALIAAGTDPAIDTLNWILDDPRLTALVELVVTLTLCHLYKRITSGNVPEFRANECERANKDLLRIQKGDLDIGLVRRLDAELKPKVSGRPRANWYW